MAAQIGKPMTIERNDMLHLAQQGDLVWIFKILGHVVKHIDADGFDAAIMLAGSSMALLSVALDGLLDGSVKKGRKRADALDLAAHATLGMAEMFRTGVQLADFQECFVTGGSTITGLTTVESAGVRGAFARGTIDGTEALRE